MNNIENNKINWKKILIIFFVTYSIFGSFYYFIAVSYIVENIIEWLLFLLIISTVLLFLVSIILASFSLKRRRNFVNSLSTRVSIISVSIFLGYSMAHYSSEKFFPTPEMNFKNNVFAGVYGDIPEKDVIRIKKMFNYIGYMQSYTGKPIEIKINPASYNFYYFKDECVNGDVEVQTEGGTHIYLIRKVDNQWKIIDKHDNIGLPYR